LTFLSAFDTLARKALLQAGLDRFVPVLPEKRFLFSMRSYERKHSLLQSPRLAWNILARGQYAFVYDQMPMTITGMSGAKKLNLCRSAGNLLYRRLYPWSMPLHMQFELTNYCDLRCPVCPIGIQSVERRPAAMDVGLFERVMEEVGPYLLTASLWNWGEPLLHPQLEEVLRVARKHPVVLLLSTNGQTLDDERVQEAVLRQPPSHLIVAIDGLADETNSRYRAGAHLKPALDGVRRLAEQKRQRGQTLPLLHMRYLVMSHNQHELPGVEAFARENGFDMLSLRRLSLIDTESPDALHGAFAPDQECWRAYEYDGCIRLHRGDFICQEPFWFPTLLADGTLVACEQDYNARLAFGRVSGNISFADVWRSEKSVEVRRAIRDHAEELTFCRNCPYRDRAETDGSAEAVFLNDKIDFANVLALQTAEAGHAS
jgi:radical SAM protein with 4Fe4S-binding SPASM domain